MKDEIFTEQILEDIKLIQEKLSWDSNIVKDEYAFNYWVLSNLYGLDEEECNTNITEYNDKGIDCFVHYKEDRELYIIQNKYYDKDTQLNSREVSDFLTRPIASLEEGKYKNSELQKIYNQTKSKNYKIFLHFYVKNNFKATDITNLFNHQGNKDVIAEIFYLDDIKEKYYKDSFKENQYLDCSLSLEVKASALRILPEEYKLSNMSKAFYVMAKVFDIYQLWNDAKNNDYELFEENIREYLGGTGTVNKEIINTLTRPEERDKFFYYNNGITIICQDANATAQEVKINNPQIVNGCQTVNSIVEVLKHDCDSKYNFSDIYIMAKIIVIDNKNQKSSAFYRSIVKYTNSQNAINEKVFGATLQPFFTIQKKIKELGFLVTVKQSDKNTFKETYKDSKKKGKLLELANKKSANFYSFRSIPEIQIPLETLIQIIGAFKKDAHFSYTKKSYLLKPNSKEYYQDFSTKIGDFFTTDDMTKLIILYKKSEHDKKQSQDKKSPSPYYLLNFFGCYLDNKNINKNSFLKAVNMDQLSIVYKELTKLPSKYYERYKQKHGLEYNQMIKQKIDTDIMQEVLSDHFRNLKEHNDEKYKEFMDTFQYI